MARPADPNAHAALIAAARKEFVRVGIRQARIEDLTAACGLSKGAFYLHFPSKEALFGSLVEALKEQFEVHRKSREAAYLALGAAAAKRGHGPAFVTELAALDAREDKKLLEVMWEWRDVTDVLLRGAQGTVFEGVMWAMLDEEVTRVEQECRKLQRAHLVRADLPGDVLGLTVVGTYLLVARRLSGLSEKPDFDHWVSALQKLLAEGMRPGVSPPKAPKTPKTPRAPTARRRAAPRRARSTTR